MCGYLDYTPQEMYILEAPTMHERTQSVADNDQLLLCSSTPKQTATKEEPQPATRTADESMQILFYSSYANEQPAAARGLFCCLLLQHYYWHYFCWLAIRSPYQPASQQ